MLPYRVVDLRLPDGRVSPIRGDPADASVFQPIEASGGDWEAHVGKWFRSVVRPDWVCVDVGANIGAHTLGMAALATAGRVLAVEAGRLNHQLLSDNVAAMPEPHARVSVLHAAAWDAPGSLSLAFAERLGGCGFLAQVDAEEGGRLLRLANPGALPDEALQVRMEEVAAMRLDDLLSPLDRVDLIKMDVEGAEARVLAGAAQVLARFKPLLLTEYNPSCAVYSDTEPSTYFDLLRSLFAAVRAVEDDGALSDPLESWEALERRLSSGRPWADLVCSAD